MSSRRRGGFRPRIGVVITWASLAAVGCGGSSGGDDGVGGGDTGLTGDANGNDSSNADGSTIDSGANDDTGATDTSNGGDTGGTDTGSTSDDTGTNPDAPDGGHCAPATCGADSDCDGITDVIEGRFSSPSTDTDADGTPDYLDLDSDGDTIPDAIEWRVAGCPSTTDDANDADGDGTPNFQDLDSDDNGLADKVEVCPPGALAPAGCAGDKPADFDGDGLPDWVDFDNDHDSSSADKSQGLPDKTELADDTGKFVGLTLDTDGDKIPDVYDVDSDNDFILDLDDGTSDTDGDGVKAFRDLDSDGDAVPDACEARANATPTTADYTLPLRDTNGDGTFDYLDLDSDSDFLADGKEDVNGNCAVDAQETNRIKADTDGDGTPDLPEVALNPAGQNWPTDPTKNPENQGEFFFIEAFSSDGSKKPSPANATLALQTNLTKGDVSFMVDTTVSMDEEIVALHDSLATTIIPKLAAQFTDLGIGLAAHDDFPVASDTNTGGAGVSKPFYIAPTGFISTNQPSDSVTAANTLVKVVGGVTTGITHPGGDLPECQVAAMMHALTGGVLTWTGSSPGSIPVDSNPGGGMHFRSGSLPILMEITDAGFHMGKRALNTTPTGAAGDYDAAYQFAYGSDVTTSPNVDQLATALNAIGGKFIGVASSDNDISIDLGNPDAPYPYLAYLADKTGSYVPKTAFKGVPPACRTGLDGQARAADGLPSGGAASCRLVFQIHTNGTGLANSIVDGVSALLNSIAFDVHVKATPDLTGTTVDSVNAFVTSIAPDVTAGTDKVKDPVTNATCIDIATPLADKYNTPKAFPGAGDIKETITGLNPGKLYCFTVNPKPNVTVAPTTVPQTFRATLTVIADATGGSLTLGAPRDVLFIVPPSLN